MKLIVLSLWLLSFMISLCNGWEINRMDYFADKIGKDISDLFKNELNYNNIIYDFEYFHGRGYFQLHSLDPEKIVRKYSKQLGDLLANKMASLNKAVRYAEGVATNYNWNASLKISDFHYINAKKIQADDPRMTQHPLFVDKVVQNESSVHIPTELYEGDIEVLNAIKMSQELDTVWKKNWREDPNLLWQYFASHQGIFRTFPGLRWRNEGVDMYDVRRRPWYVQGSSSPKDVLIMIDTSGSMHGRSLQLTKLSVKKLIDAMGENDYVAVAQFPGQFPHSLDPKGRSGRFYPHFLLDKPKDKNSTCFKTFVQATKRNKDRIFNQVERLSAQGIAHMDDMITFAFDTFAQFNRSEEENNPGAKCNQLIVIFTDGGAFYPKNIIDQYKKVNSSFAKIRIFTYSVGEQVNPVEALQKMACFNKGSFGTIPAIGAVSNIIQDVSSVLSRPMSSAAGKYYVWHNIYLDSLGMGLMTSLTMPVYNKTSNGSSLLGLLGTDATVKDLMDRIPIYKLGANGYAFAINTNGYIIFHPELRAQRGWMRDPPNVDLLEVEFDSFAKREVRKRIIQYSRKAGSTESMRIEGLVKIPDEIHTYIKTRIYAYTGIPASTFGVCIVNSLDNKYYPKISALKNISIKRHPTDNSLYIQIPELASIKFDLLEHARLLISPDISDRCQWPTKQTKNIRKTNSSLIIKNQAYASPTIISPEGVLPLSKFNSGEKRGSSPFPAMYKYPPVEDPIDMRLDSGSYRTANISLDGQSDNHTYEAWKSASDTSNQDNIRLLTAERFVDLLATNTSACDSDMLSRTLFDLLIAQRYSSHIRSREKGQDVLSSVLSLNSGVTLVWPPQDYKRYLDLQHNLKSAIYQRTMDTKSLIFWIPLKQGYPPYLVNFTNHHKAKNYYYSVHVSSHHEAAEQLNPTSKTPTLIPPVVPPSELSVSIFRSLQMRYEDHDYQLGVIGLTLRERAIQSYFQLYQGCSNSSQFTCYLVEDAAYIVAVNSLTLKYQVGYFLGYVDASLMKILLEVTIFHRVREFDYQGSCPKGEEEQEFSSASSSIYNQPILALYKLLLKPKIVFQIISSMANQIISIFTIIINLLSSIRVSGQETTATTSNQNQSCIKLAYRYYLREDGSHEAQGSFNCSSTCLRYYQAARIIDTNLVLISVSPICSDCLTAEEDKFPINTPIKRDPIKDNGPDICLHSESPRFRLRPSQCYNDDDSEDTSICPATNISPLPSLSLLALLTTTMILAD